MRGKTRLCVKTRLTEAAPGACFPVFDASIPSRYSRNGEQSRMARRTLLLLRFWRSRPRSHRETVATPHPVRSANSCCDQPNVSRIALISVGVKSPAARQTASCRTLAAGGPLTTSPHLSHFSTGTFSARTFTVSSPRSKSNSSVRVNATRCPWPHSGHFAPPKDGCSFMARSHPSLRMNTLVNALDLGVLLTDTAFANPQFDEDVSAIRHLPSDSR